MTDSNAAHDDDGPDSVLHSRVADEFGAPRAFRAFSFVLVGVAFSAFLLILVVTFAAKGWSEWSSAYLRPATWLFVAVSAPLSVPLTNWYLKRRAIQAAAYEQSCMLMASRAVAVSFFLIGILAIANT